MPLSSSPFLHYSALAFGTVPVIIGLTIFTVSPSWPLSAGTYPPTSATATPADRKTLQSFLYYFAARDLTIGLITLAVVRSGNRQTMGTVCLIGTGMAVMDGLINRWQVPGTEWKHWSFVPFGFALGAGLLGWLDGVL